MANLFRGGRKKTNDIIISWSLYYKTFFTLFILVLYLRVRQEPTQKEQIAVPFRQVVS
jgi:hypothetical protein